MSAPKPEAKQEKSAKIAKSTAENSLQNNPKGRPCSICGDFKEWDAFELDKRRPSGHGPRCHECLTAKRKAKPKKGRKSKESKKK